MTCERVRAFTLACKHGRKSCGLSHVGPGLTFSPKTRNDKRKKRRKGTGKIEEKEEEEERCMRKRMIQANLEKEERERGGGKMWEGQ